MQIHDMVKVINAKADFFGDQELAFIAQELELHAQMEALPPAVLLSIPAVARTLSLSSDYVWKLVAAGELPSLKIGKRRLIRHRDVIAFAEGTQS